MVELLANTIARSVFDDGMKLLSWNTFCISGGLFHCTFIRWEIEQTVIESE